MYLQIGSSKEIEEQNDNDNAWPTPIWRKRSLKSNKELAKYGKTAMESLIATTDITGSEHYSTVAVDSHPVFEAGIPPWLDTRIASRSPSSALAIDPGGSPYLISKIDHGELPTVADPGIKHTQDREPKFGWRSLRAWQNVPGFGEKISPNSITTPNFGKLKTKLVQFSNFGNDSFGNG